MMKIKFNKFERVAGFLVLATIVGGIATAITVAIKQGWFDKKIYYTTTFENADGVHPGTLVQISGLRAGNVEDVELQNDNKIKVRFYVNYKFAHRIKQDSQAQLIRPFIIGDRVLDLTVGAEGSEPLPPDSFILSHETVDMMTLLSGKKLGNYLASIVDMTENLKELAVALLDKNRTKSLIHMFDRIDPLLKNLNTMSVEVIKLSKQATQDENLGVVLGNLKTTTSELNAMIPALQEKAPNMANDVASIVENLAILTKEFKVVVPALAEVAPDLPHASRRAVEALDEAVVLLKAMQKSMFLKGNVEDVREEEAQEAVEKKQNKNRLPAGDKSK